jgi:DNA-binding transcriptional ArsR family regulator
MLMNASPDLSTIAALIGEPSRAAILAALMGGQSLPASELAYRAQITPQTTSSHLSRLVEGGLLDIKRIGRHRYYRLKNADVAQALEALSVISPLPVVRSKQQSEDLQALHFARTCYDHLAGKLGVAVTQALLDKNLLVLENEDYHVTQQGEAWLTAWDIDIHQLHKGRRQFACACLDWSERRYHVAGALGSAIVTKFFEKGWILRASNSRAVRLTEAGRTGFKRELSVSI